MSNLNPVTEFANNYAPNALSKHGVHGVGVKGGSSLLNGIIRDVKTNKMHEEFIEKINAHQSKAAIQLVLNKQELSKITNGLYLEMDKPQLKELIGLQLDFAQEGFKDAVRDMLYQKLNETLLKKLDNNIFERVELGIKEAFADIFQVQSVYGKPGEALIHVDLESNQQNAELALTEKEVFKPFTGQWEDDFSSFEAELVALSTIDETI